MRFSSYLFVSWLALLGGLSSISLSGCGANKSLGGGSPEDAGAGGTGGVTTVTGGNTAVGGATTTAGGASAASTTVGGASSAGATAAAGQTTVASSIAPGGSSAVAGKTAAAGASASSSSGTAGISSAAGKTASGGSVIGASSAGGIVALGGSTLVNSGGAGGATASGGAGGAAGVILTATLLENTGTVQATWQNNTQASIFLYGCGTVEAFKKESSGWKNLGASVLCTWEGVSPEVKAGESYVDRTSYVASKLGGGTGGTFHLSGKYGVGCTNPSAGQSKAGCTAFYEATSNEFTVVVPPVADAGVDAVCGTMPEGVTCKKPAGGCAAMTCINGSWACASGQTPVALVPGACDIPDAATGN